MTAAAARPGRRAPVPGCPPPLRRLPLLALLLLAAARPEPATSADARFRAAAANETRLATERVAAAARLQETEAALADRAAAVSALAERRDAAAARLRDRAAALGPLLPLMQRLALFPAETMLAVPAPPADTLRGLLVLRGVAARLQGDAAALRAGLADLDVQARALAEGMASLQALAATQAEQSRALDAQLATARADRDAAADSAAEAARRAAAEAAHADSLRAAVAAAEAGRARAEARARDDAARAERGQRDAAAAEARRREAVLASPAAPPGQWSAPVAGSVVRAWGTATEAGPATGISFRAAPSARVVAPCAGRVRFAGPFRSYGGLLILDCGGGYAAVLAGLDRLDVSAGAAVLRGEPVGVMPSWNPAAPGASRPALYVELRRDGQAVDPGPFLRDHG